MAKILVLFYSTYGHIYEMALAAAEGAKNAGAEVVIKRVPETLPMNILEKMGAVEAQKKFEHIPIIENRNEIVQYDGIIFGCPTRFGVMAAQMKTFLDSLGQIWFAGSLGGKIGGAFTSTATQHGGNEFTIISFHIVLFHLGLIIAGMPATFKGMMGVEEIKGGAPYGATTIVGSASERNVSETDKAGAYAQGEYIAQIAMKLTKK